MLTLVNHIHFAQLFYHLGNLQLVLKPLLLRDMAIQKIRLGKFSTLQVPAMKLLIIIKFRLLS